MRQFAHAFFVVLGAGSVLCGCASRVLGPDFYGAPAPVSAATQTVVIRPDTRFVNVRGGDIVRFIAGDRDFAWNFIPAAGINRFRLNEVAPPGVLDHDVIAYVAPDPHFINGDGKRGR